MELGKLKDKETQYLFCPRYKNQPRKHVEVCRSCRWNRNCEAYQIYLQPYLPLPSFPDKDFIMRSSASWSRHKKESTRKGYKIH